MISNESPARAWTLRTSEAAVVRLQPDNDVKRIVIAGLLAGVVACQPESRTVSLGAEGDTVVLGLHREIAPGLHPLADSLGQASGLAVDAAGNLYVSDLLASTIWVLDEGGSLVQKVGRLGEGPGEFEAPTGAAIGPDGYLYVRDPYRVTVFGPDPVSGILSGVIRTFEGPVYPDWTSARATRFDERGGVLYPGGGSRPFMLRYNVSGILEDTIYAPVYANAPQRTAFVRTGPSGGRTLPGLNHVPFAPLPVWDATPAGTIISGDGRSYELVETDPTGMVVNRVRREVTAERIPATERDDSMAALRARLDSIPVPLENVTGMPDEVRSLNVPLVYPAYMAVHIGVEGDVWVRRWPVGGGDRTIFDVFTRGGEYQQTVLLPRTILIEPTPVLSASHVIGVAKHPLTDEDMILAFRPQP